MTWLAREILASTFRLIGASVLFFAALLAGMAGVALLAVLIAGIRAAL